MCGGKDIFPSRGRLGNVQQSEGNGRGGKPSRTPKWLSRKEKKRICGESPTMQGPGGAPRIAGYSTVRYSILYPTSLRLVRHLYTRIKIP